ncbi:MAG: CPBP family intramembrane metalloprotease [Candidatus Sulcia muelleri]|uniref:CAAX amino terminal protease family protein n=1 Tax=Karelsulcia muelleri (strain GWSS) TaxID=444179 RepID=A8Z612_KARMG|nr:CAAX amino terminal protease family protein [Candidatus Karelsulcia muelleri GWSS]MCJ7422548.1 CPBP family intramembrane metalloprotease [Candidatus Karelsulcia muelleri]MCJ7468823.1 CPBP family intramembrane metalloprotease [Candidatus Karelsulcia muelleri]
MGSNPTPGTKSIKNRYWESIEIILKLIIYIILTFFLKCYLYSIGINKYILFYVFYALPYLLIILDINIKSIKREIKLYKNKNLIEILILIVIITNFVIKKNNKEIEQIILEGYKYPYTFIPTITLLAPFCEEILFRGIILNVLLNNNQYLAILFSSFLFGFIHMNTLQFINGFIIGNIIGVSLVTTFSINKCIIIHIINNIIAI